MDCESLGYSAGELNTVQEIATPQAFPVTTFTYDTLNHLTSRNDGGLLSSWSYRNGVVQSETVGGGEDVTRLTPVAAVGLGTLGNGPPAARQEDPLSRATLLTLDAQGRLLRRDDPTGATTLWARDANGRVTAETDPLNRTTTFQLDAQGYDTQTTLPDGSTRQYQYQTAFHALTASVDELGRRTSYAYDASGHVTGVANALNQTSTSAYYTSGPQTGLLQSVTDPLGHTTAFQYDADRRLTLTTDALGGTTSTAYDANGNVQSVRDARGFTTGYQYDAMGRLLQRTNPLGGLATWSYLADTDRATKWTDENGYSTTYAYDDRGLLLGSTRFNAQEVRVLDRAGRLLSDTNGDGFATQFQYDAGGRVVRATNPLGGQTLYAYDLAGEQTAARDELGRWTQSAYDVRGRITQLTDPLGDTTTDQYDAAGELVRVTDPLGRKTRSDYDALGRVTAVTQAEGTGLARTQSDAFDAAGNLTLQTDFAGVGTTYAYDALNHLTGRTDAAGTAVQRRYGFQTDALGDVTQTTDPYGLATTVAFDALGRVTATTVGAGTATPATALTGYDGVGNVTRVTDPVGAVTTYRYDPLDRVTGTMDAVGRNTSNAYDAVGNLVARVVLAADGSVATTLTYDALNRLVKSDVGGGSTGGGPPGSVTERVVQTVYDAAGHAVLTLGPRAGQVARADFDAAGRAVRRVQSTDGVTPYLERTTTFAYDAAGQMTATVDPLGRPTTTGYDALGRRTEIDEPLGKTTRLAYDLVDDVTGRQDPLGRVTSFQYDALRRRVGETDAAGTSQQRTSTTVYDLVGDVVNTIDPLGDKTTNAYDALHRLTATTDALNQTTTYSSDLDGRLIGSTDPLGRQVVYQYDGAGRKVLETVGAQLPAAQQTTTTYAYDLHDKPLSTSVGGVVVAQYLYDAFGDPTYLHDANGTLWLQYDAAGNTVRTQDMGTNVTTYQYDLFDRRTEAIDAAGGVATYAYDLVGNTTSLTDRDGRRRDFQFDALNRATQETWYNANGTVADTIASTRDLDNEVLTIHNAAGSLAYGYDALGRTTTATDVFGVTLTLSYDARDLRTQMQDSTGGLLTYAYDGAGRLLGETLAEAGSYNLQVGWSYDSANEPTQVGYGGASFTTYLGYDGAARLTNVNVYDLSNNPIDTLYDSIDPKTGLVNQEIRIAYSSPNHQDVNYSYTTPFQYDTSGQLTQEGSRQYAYDASGNLTATGLRYGPANRLLEDTLYTYAYDAEGDQTGKTNKANGLSWSYGYDLLNRMTSATEKQGNGLLLAAVTYSYDAAGRRVGRTEADFDPTTGLLTATYAARYAYDGQTLLADLDGSGHPLTRYLHGPDGTLLGQMDVNTGTRSWYISDRSGSVIDVLSDAGGVLQRYKYTGFKTQAEELAAQQVATRFQFNGREYDFTLNLFYWGGQWYDPSLGRFINESPGGLAGTNLYRYAQNSPRNVKDPPASEGDVLDQATNFFAGMSDALTGGLTARVRKAMGTDAYVNGDSTMYKVGGYAGQAVNIGLMFVDPLEAEGVVAGLFDGLNKTQMVGGALNAAEAADKGDWLSAGLFAVGAAAGALRGVTPCGWASTAVEWTHRGVLAVSAARDGYQAYGKWQDGDYLGALLDGASAAANLYHLGQSCFTGDTKLLTRRGWRPIKDIVVGDEVWSRPEDDPDAPGAWKRVEAVFMRAAAPVVDLRVGGRVIRTTAKHPFRPREKGWTECRGLAAGDELCGKDGEWTAAEGVADDGAWATVYNLRVADYHTYFVGGDDWGFAVWAHNSDCIISSGGEEHELIDIESGRVLKAGTEEEVRAFAEEPKNGHTLIETENLTKAPQPGKGEKLFEKGFLPEDFSDPIGGRGDNSAYLWKGKGDVETWAGKYGEGVLEVLVPKELYDARLQRYEAQMDAGPHVELAVPHSDFDALNAGWRIWHR